MSKNKAILQRWEIVEFTGLPDIFSTCNIQSVFQVERLEFLACLGKDFYNQLKENLIEYECVLWDKDTNYTEGQTVFYKGIVKVALQDSINVLPSNKEYWVNAPRFESECLNDLWCTFLGPYIAWLVVRNNVPFMYRQISANGFTKASSQNFDSISKEDLDVVAGGIAREIETHYCNLVDELENNNESGCYDLFAGNQKGCGCHCGCKITPCKCHVDCLKEKHLLDYRYDVG